MPVRKKSKILKFNFLFGVKYSCWDKLSKNILYIWNIGLKKLKHKVNWNSIGQWNLIMNWKNIFKVLETQSTDRFWPNAGSVWPLRPADTEIAGDSQKEQGQEGPKKREDRQSCNSTSVTYSTQAQILHTTGEKREQFYNNQDLINFIIGT